MTRSRTDAFFLSPRWSAVSRQAAWALLLCAALVWYAKFRTWDVIRWTPFTGAFHGNDFIHLYLGAYLLSHGMDPYDLRTIVTAALRFGLTDPTGAPRLNPYVYLPSTGLALSPLVLASPASAMRIWFALNHLFLVASLALIFRSFDLRLTLRNAAMAASMAAVCFPFHRTLSAGQLNVALLFLFSLVYAFDRRNRHAAAGAAAAFAFVFKLIPGILLPYFAWRALVSSGGSARAWRQRWAAAAWMTGFALLFLAGSVAAAGLFSEDGLRGGIRQHLAFRETLSQMGYGRSTWGHVYAFYRYPGNQSFNSFFHHIATDSGDGIRPWFELGADWANRLTRIATAACYAIAIWALWPWRRRWRERNGEASDRAMPYAVFIILGLLTPSLCWDHYALILLWPLMAYHAQLPERERTISLVLFLLVVSWLGACLTLRAWQTASLLVPAAGLAAALVASRRPRRIEALLWSAAAALLFARFAFDYAGYRQGLGLVAMSLRLWGTLILFGLCLAECVRHGGPPRERAQATADCGSQLWTKASRRRTTADPGTGAT